MFPDETSPYSCTIGITPLVCALIAPAEATAIDDTKL
jgi:hypothetical protein